MTTRKLASTFFFLYGCSIPILATAFMDEIFWATIAMIGCCLVLSILALVRRCDFFNILISFYVFKVYLIRPYVDIFSTNLTYIQSGYIEANDSFFNSSDAIVVYVGLFSLLLAWLIGVVITRPESQDVSMLPKIFIRLDNVIRNSSWRFWLVWILLVTLNYVPASTNWQGIAADLTKTDADGGVPLFAFGLTQPATIGIVCLFTFLHSRWAGNKNVSWMLLVPVLYQIVVSTLSGSRGGAFLIFVYTILYLIFLNYDKKIYASMKNFLFMGATALVMSLVMLAGLVAQTLRPLLRIIGMENSVVLATALRNINMFESNNVILGTLYFGLTEILHRLSALQAQFLILNDHFINSPWESFNPLSSLMRTLNDLTPGSVFPDLLTINQLFHHIYLDESINYSSHMWGIQGTLYMYVGLWFSPFIIILLAYFVSSRWIRINHYIKSSPSFMVFVMLLSLAILENATMERIIPVDIVRPLASFFILTFLVKFLDAFFPRRRLILR